ncbi:MAG: sugar phosphate nucleotidyltransferase [Verrucomicrobia bacterium]|nr:sugar phosphate nucleotidyltransferase [Verrucomicrobiota bacterium]
MNQLYAVIMAGGRGERFWPLSTSKTPKQVLSLIGDQSLLAMAVERLHGLIPPERVFIITSADLVAVTAKAAPQLPRENIIGEPFGRDTAAACALASTLVKARDPEGTFCIVTADHIMGDLEVFRQTLQSAATMAQQESALVTIGINPTFPSTGFGYIDAGDALESVDGIAFFRARRFVEKPDHDTAAAYIKAGNYFWNSGMFIWTVATFQDALRQFQPVLLAMAEHMQAHVGKATFTAELEKEYGKLERISVDYAIMEKAGNILMAQGTFRWDDVGTWPALANHLEEDEQGNVLIGACEQIDSTGNVVVSKGRLTALIGVDNLVVVQAANATLICPKDRAQDVKRMVTLLGDTKRYDQVL